MKNIQRKGAAAMGWNRSGRRRHAFALLAAGTLALAGCDFEVTNPGPVEDEVLDDPKAHPAVVFGAARALSDALNATAYTTAAVTRELFPAGSTSSFGITPRQQQGILAYDDEHVGWTSHHRARFIAETGYERFAASLPSGVSGVDGYELAGRIALWAGYANRLLGENWCQVTFDGGPPVPDTDVLKRAEGWFSKAITVGEKLNKADITNAGYAGRASVRAWLGDWAGAVSDAGRVPTGFKFVMNYNNLEQDQYNRIFWAAASTPYRAHTVWSTVNEAYYTQTRDPRVPWATHPTQKVGDAAVLDLGRVTFYQQQKHNDRGSDINLSSGREMRLIEAEAKLRSGDIAGMLAIINSLRSSLNVASVPQVSATTTEEAWAVLKRERGIELWLEGRRMGDLRRWSRENAPGALAPEETPGVALRLSPNRSLCYDIPLSERETNPHVPLSP